MNTISDEDLVLLYYGEQEDAGLAARVAASPVLSARYEKLTRDLAPLDHLSAPPRDEEYGADTWLRISSRLAKTPDRPAGLIESLRQTLSRPRFSLAGLAAIAIVAALAFQLGRQDAQNSVPMMPGDESMQAAELQLEASRLLSSTVSGHLDQIDIMLTEFVNTEQTPAWEAEQAMDVLVANRLYRRAAAARGEQKLAAFLGSLEPMLVELAYETYRNSPQTRERMQQEANDTLLFRVRAVSQQLQNPTLST